MMPPKGRTRPSDPPAAASPAASTANQSAAASSPSHPSTSFALDGDDAPPFLNTTFTTHRASPLYIGSHPLTQERLHVLSQRLRDVLVGDVVRGVEVGLDRGADDATMRRAGALEVVAMGWVRLEGLMGRHVATGEEGAQDQATPARSDAADQSGVSLDTTASGSPGKRRALQISLQYENTECAALLLPSLREARSDTDAPPARGDMAAATSVLGMGDARPDESDPEFLHLPLLLLRMPAPLRAVIIDFISRTFDCRISSLSLGTRSLVGALERWMRDSKVPTKGHFAKDVVLTLGFYGPTVTQYPRQAKEAAKENHAEEEEEDDGSKGPETTVGIKSIDVIIPNQDLRRFAKVGSIYERRQSATLDQVRSKRKEAFEGDVQDTFGHAKRRRLGGDKDEESWTWRQWDAHPKQPAAEAQGTRSQPFTEALAQHVREHLALDMFHPAVRVVKIACGGFVLSEGRVKIFGAIPDSNGEGALPDSKQRALWAVMDGLLDRAQVKPWYRPLSEGAGVQIVRRTPSASTNVETSRLASEM